MPYKLDGNCVVKESGEKVKCHATHEEALAHLRALEANVPDAHAEHVAFEPFKQVNPTAPIKILPIGKFYRGTRVLDITEERAKQTVANFQLGLPRYGVNINVEHGEDNTQPGRTGKVKKVEYRPGDGVYATELEWTSTGQKLLEEDRYGGVSPEMVWSLNNNAKYQDPETGNEHDNVLVGLALTNSPFFGQRVQVFSDVPQQTQTDSDLLKWLVRTMQAVGQKLGVVAPVQPIVPEQQKEEQKKEQPKQEPPKEKAADDKREDFSMAPEQKKKMQELMDGGMSEEDARKKVMGGEGMGEQITPEQFAAQQKELETLKAKVAEAETFKAEKEALKAKLESEEKARQKLETDFMSERQLRRLNEFTEAAEKFSAFPAKQDELGKQLLWLNDADATQNKEHYSYFEGLFTAAQNIMQDSEHFKTIGSGRNGGNETSPFMQAVEKIRVEEFKDKPRDEGWNLAFIEAGKRHPDMAREYIGH